MARASICASPPLPRGTTPSSHASPTRRCYFFARAPPPRRPAAQPPLHRLTRRVLGVRAQALAREVGAEGFLLASSEPNTLTRLPPLLLPLPTYVMPAHHFVDVPEGKTPHQVEEE